MSNNVTKSNSLKPLCRAAKGENVWPPPCWLMRQAGRYLPEYRAFREKADTLTMFKTPAIAAEITLQPLRRYSQLDAAIVYADILLIPDAMGLGLHFVKGEGPKFTHPIRTNADWNATQQRNNDHKVIIDKLSYVAETLTKVKPHLAPHQALLGFAGAPFTVASYMVEAGGTSGTLLETKKLCFQNPSLMHELLNKVTDITIDYLNMQIDVGIDALQLFESWGGALAPHEYQEFAAPYADRVLKAVSQRVPTIHFVGESAGILSAATQVHSDVFSVDWRQDLQNVMTHCQQKGIHKGLQGNLDPLLLHATPEKLEKEARTLLTKAKSWGHGYIFNLGHGIHLETPVEAVAHLLKVVKSS